MGVVSQRFLPPGTQGVRRLTRFVEEPLTFGFRLLRRFAQEGGALLVERLVLMLELIALLLGFVLFRVGVCEPPAATPRARAARPGPVRAPSCRKSSTPRTAPSTPDCTPPSTSPHFSCSRPACSQSWPCADGSQTSPAQPGSTVIGVPGRSPLPRIRGGPGRNDLAGRQEELPCSNGSSLCRPVPPPAPPGPEDCLLTRREIDAERSERDAGRGGSGPVSRAGPGRLVAMPGAGKRGHLRHGRMITSTPQSRLWAPGGLATLGSPPRPGLGLWSLPLMRVCGSLDDSLGWLPGCWRQCSGGRVPRMAWIVRPEASSCQSRRSAR